jgi:dienelactone hydrolase
LNALSGKQLQLDSKPAPEKARRTMFEYFPDNYPWSTSVMIVAQTGGEMSEIDEACRPLREQYAQLSPSQRASAWWESWCRVADRVRGLAERDRQNGFSRAAARKFKRACVYYMAAERQLGRHDARKMKSYDAMLETFALSIKLSKNPVQFVDIPFEGSKLPALYVTPSTAKPGACMILFDGFDQCKEGAFLSDLTTELTARKIGCLYVDHPGVGAALRKLNLPAIPDIERAASASIDWLFQRKEVDQKRIGIMAVSLGGYYSFRSAAFEHRLACAVAHGARWDNDGSHGRILRNPDAARSLADWLDHAMWYYGTKTKEDTAAAIAAMTLEGGVAERIRCPVLVAHGKNDRQVPIEQAYRMIERAINSSQRDLRIFDESEGGVEHVGCDNLSIQIDYMADWISKVLTTDAD